MKIPLARVAALAAILAASSARAASPRTWTTESARDFSAGTTHGLAVAPEGRLVLASAAAPIRGLSVARVFSVAVDSRGTAYLATGDDGQLFVCPPGGEARPFVKLPEDEVTAVVVSKNGQVFAATSPNGKVYRIDGQTPRPVFAPGQQYIWTLAAGPDGVLYVGTGSPGRIYAVRPDGTGKILWESPDDHVRCLLLDSSGRIWAGTSGKGLLVRIDRDGRATTLYDSQKTEIASLAADPSGSIWASAVSASFPAPVSHAAPPPSAEHREGAASASEPAHPSASVTVSTSFGPLPSGPPVPPPTTPASSEIVRVAPDDSVVEEWRSSDELALSLAFDPERNVMAVGTGPKGRLYWLSHREAALAGSFDEKELYVLAPGIVVTGSPSAAYHLSRAARGDYTSSIRDTGRRSRFGAYRVEIHGESGSPPTLSFRSGNSSVPDSTWNAWSAPVSAISGKIPSPAGRFLQWKAEMGAGEKAEIQSVECVYENFNAAPIVESIAASANGGWEPGGPPPAPSSAGSPVPGAIFSPGPERPSSPSAERGRGQFLLTWKASDPDGDPLSFDVDVRSEAGGGWIPLRRDLSVPSLTFDPTLLPDGRYEFRVTASDRSSNPEDPKSDSRDSDSIVVDNTPPKIVVGAPGRDDPRSTIRFRVTDELSPIAQVWWSVNANAWRSARPDDGMTDSREESYQISLKPDERGAYVLIRAIDAAGNAASISVVSPSPSGSK